MKCMAIVVLASALAGCSRNTSRTPDPALPSTIPTSAPVPATMTAPVHLTVMVTDLRSPNGQLLFCIFKSAEGFPGDSKFAVNSQVKRVGKVNDFQVDLPPGKYAVAIVHDENGNGKLDTNFLGIPKEGYGASNNPKPRRRGVNYGESEFTLPATGDTISVSLQYDFF